MPTSSERGFKRKQGSSASPKSFYIHSTIVPLERQKGFDKDLEKNNRNDQGTEDTIGIQKRKDQKGEISSLWKIAENYMKMNEQPRAGKCWIQDKYKEESFIVEQ